MGVLERIERAKKLIAAGLVIMAALTAYAWLSMPSIKGVWYPSDGARVKLEMWRLEESGVKSPVDSIIKEYGLRGRRFP